MTTNIELLVKLSAAKGSTGPHEQGAVVFSYVGLNQTGKQVLENSDGTLNLRDLSKDFTLKFVLDESTLAWNGDVHDVRFPQSASDALWIFEDQLNKKAYPGTEKEFQGFGHAQHSTRQALVVNGRNRRYFIYDYAIAVEVSKPGGRIYTHRDDPQIKNGGLNFNGLEVLQRLQPLLLAVVSLLLVIDIGVRFWKG